MPGQCSCERMSAMGGGRSRRAVRPRDALERIRLIASLIAAHRQDCSTLTEQQGSGVSVSTPLQSASTNQNLLGGISCQSELHVFQIKRDVECADYNYAIAQDEIAAAWI